MNGNNIKFISAQCLFSKKAVDRFGIDNVIEEKTKRRRQLEDRLRKDSVSLKKALMLFEEK